MKGIEQYVLDLGRPAILSHLCPYDLNYPILNFPKRKIKIMLPCEGDMRTEGDVGECLAVSGI